MKSTSTERLRSLTADVLLKRKMGRFQKANAAVVIIAVILGLAYLSKPDRGGVERCARIFEMSSIADSDLTHRPFYAWKPFESPKFRFTISEGGFARIAIELRRLGYTEWERGGVTYGSVDVGWTGSEDNIYCKLTNGGFHRIWSYSRRKKLIYAITFPT